MPCEEVPEDWSGQPSEFRAPFDLAHFDWQRSKPATGGARVALKVNPEAGVDVNMEACRLAGSQEE
eukprot:960078-Alexandrium_andersonii.AAC.1